MDAALSPLRQMGIRHSPTTSTTGFILAQSEWNYFHTEPQIPHPQPLRAPGLRVNFAKSALSPSQRISFLGTVLDSAHIESGDSARTRSGHSENSRPTFKSDTASPTQVFQRMLGPYGRSIASVTAGPAPHAPPSTLVNHGFPQQRMASRTLAYQGESGLCNSPDPLEEPTVDGEGRGHGVGPHQDSCHDRRLQHRLGGTVRRQTDLRPLVGDGERLPHQLLGNASSLSSLPVFLPDLIGRHVLIRSDNMSVVSYINHQGGVSSKRLFILAERLLEWAQRQPALAEGSTPAGQTEPRSGYIISEQCPLRGVDAASAGGSEDLEDLWQGRSRPFRLQRQHSLPQLIIRRTGTRWPTTGPTSSFMHSPDRPASTGRQAYQGTGSQGAIGGPLVEEPTLVVRADSATDSSPLARAPETGSPLSGERKQYGTLDPSCGLSTFWSAQWEPTGFPERVLNTNF